MIINEKSPFIKVIGEYKHDSRLNYNYLDGHYEIDVDLITSEDVKIQLEAPLIIKGNVKIGKNLYLNNQYHSPIEIDGTMDIEGNITSSYSDFSQNLVCNKTLNVNGKIDRKIESVTARGNIKASEINVDIITTDGSIEVGDYFGGREVRIKQNLRAGSISVGDMKVGGDVISTGEIESVDILTAKSIKAEGNILSDMLISAESIETKGIIYSPVVKSENISCSQLFQDYEEYEDSLRNNKMEDYEM